MARHNLSGLDLTNKTATCAVCGPTDLYVRPNGKWECGTKKRLDKARYYQENPRKVLSSRKRTLYGITQDDYDLMYEEQGGRCAICSEGDIELVVDHCHASTEVRGLLCRQCNFGLGQFKDDVTVLSRAIAYLSR